MNKDLNQSIIIHNAQAKYYKYRTPYIPRLFADIEKKLQISNKSILLDLCCGTGEISKGFAEGSCNKIYSIDGSEEMLNLAYLSHKIKYICIDVNTKLFECPELVDFIFIGRAIHWLEPKMLQKLVKKNLKENGSIIILNAQWGTHEKWYLKYNAVLQKYTQQLKIVKKITSKVPDFTGKNTMEEIGFKEVDKISVQTKGKFNINWLINHTLSSNYAENLIALESNIFEFKNEMSKKLASFLREDNLQGRFSSWAIIYKKNKN